MDRLARRVAELRETGVTEAVRAALERDVVELEKARAARLKAVDTSALVAIILTELEADQYVSAIEGASAAAISAVSVFEAETVLAGRRDDRVARRVRQLIESWSIRIQPFDEAQAGLASAAYARFGKGRHPARLNMGDCAAHALAKSLDAPLLYKGEDFARTDMASALTPG